MDQQYTDPCGQSVSSIVMNVMLTFWINFYKTAKRMEHGNLVVTFYFPYLIYKTTKRLENGNLVEVFYFQIILRVDGDGRPQPGKYDCTSLNGTDRLCVLRTLPAKFDTILPSDLAVPMARLWNVSVLHECVLHILRSMQ